MGRIVAIDFGLKRTGLAITDEMNIIASPLTTVESKDLMTFLKELTLKNSIDTFVLGEPKRLNNEDTHITENVRMLKTALEK
jgi:putative Holliday junction resolvase